MKLPHLKDEHGKEQKYDRVEISSVVGLTAGAFAESPNVLSPRRRAAEAARKPSAKSSHVSLGPTPEVKEPAPLDSPFDDTRSYDAEAGGTPRDVGDVEDGDIDVDDMRFRVNGIVVDREMKGGAKANWEHVYQVLFQSSTPAGQRVALVLLIMVSLSVIVGTWLARGWSGLHVAANTVVMGFCSRARQRQGLPVRRGMAGHLLYG